MDLASTAKLLTEVAQDVRESEAQYYDERDLYELELRQVANPPALSLMLCAAMYPLQ
jgi:hypothetical protein